MNIKKLLNRRYHNILFFIFWFRSHTYEIGLDQFLVLNKLKNKKASGLDGIPPEVWKTGKLNDLLLYCNEVYNRNVFQSWTEGCILPFPKKSDLGVRPVIREG